MNCFMFTGRLGRDAELRTTTSGKSVLGFAVANDIGFGDKKTTLWIDCAMWGDRGEKIARFLTKGQEVAIQGEVSPKAFTKKDGTTNCTLSVNVRELTLVGGKSDAQPQQQSRQPSRQSGPSWDEGDEIPF